MSFLFRKNAGKGNVDSALRECALKGPLFVPLFEGWLEKKGDIAKSWQKRYFLMVQPRTLFYFTTKQNSDAFKALKTNETRSLRALAKGAIPMTATSTFTKAGHVDKKDNCFNVKPQTSKSRVFIMSAPNDSSLETWMRALQEGDSFKASPETAKMMETKASTVVMTTTSPNSTTMAAMSSQTTPMGLSMPHCVALIAMFEEVRAANQAFLEDIHAAMAPQTELAAFTNQNRNAILTLLASFEKIRAANTSYKHDLHECIPTLA
jgi:hypothetical protein